MKANVILGKKQIILASLVLILGAAVYLNWQFADKSGDLALTEGLGGEEPASASLPAEAPEEPKEKEVNGLNEDAIPEGSPAAQTGAEEDADSESPVKILGDAQLVDSKSIADETYFVMARLARTKSRDAAIQTISTILDDEQLTEEDKKLVNEKALALTDVIEDESRIENLVKAKGFEECIVYITDTGANVVVKSVGLTQDQATQIKNIVVSEGKIRGENVAITEIS